MSAISATGYVHQMLDKNESFDRWIWTCARAFGALILMRDDPMDAPIPQKFEPSDYNAKAIEQLKDELANISALTPEQAIELATKKRDEEIARYEQMQAEENAAVAKCNEMAAFVMQWKPPTDDHLGLKKFMLEQLETSTKHCSDSHWQEYADKARAKNLESWRSDRIAGIKRDIAYHEQQHAEEVERTNKRNSWLEQLRQSVESFKGEWRPEEATA